MADFKEYNSTTSFTFENGVFLMKYLVDTTFYVFTLDISRDNGLIIPEQSQPTSSISSLSIICFNISLLPKEYTKLQSSKSFDVFVATCYHFIDIVTDILYDCKDLVPIKENMLKYINE